MEKKKQETGALKMEQLVFKIFSPFTKNTAKEKYYVFLQTAATQANGY